MKLLLLLAVSALAVPMAFVAASSSNVVAAPAAVTTWTIDPVHSSVVFKVRHMGVSNFYGRFNKVSGTVVVNDENPAESKVEVTIPVESIDTNNDGRNTHLKSPDFFNAKEFPEMKFVSKSVKKTAEKHWKIEGEMTMHGVTKPLFVGVDLIGTGDAKDGKIAGFETIFTLKRSDFGMTFMLDNLGDDITVMAGLECKSAK